MAWLESTALAEWVRTSLVGYPFVLTVHSVGMAIMVGLVTVINLRLVGRFERIPYASLDGVLRLAWYGFAINAISGAAIFTSQAVSYITSPVYLLKMAMVLGGAIVAWKMQPILRRDAAGWDGGSVVPSSMRTLAKASLAMWLVAIITGRFTAYL
ncbi:MAG: hypothetical protein OEM78_16105 [Gammaproteobacteria bacterium]|nr:hypothetical protein [Gammaproteobacteria bacterium]